MPLFRTIYEKLVPPAIKKPYRAMRRWLDDLPHELRLARITRANAYKAAGRAIYTHPHRPHYLNAIRKIAAELGMPVRHSRPTGPGLFIYWPLNEETFSDGDGSMINGLCQNINKDFINGIFEDVFGLQLAIDPATHEGRYVRKSIRNARHDGVVLSEPTAAEAGYVYQRLIANEVNGMAEDIRLIYMRGCLDFVYVKCRPLGSRFSNINSVVTLEPAANRVSPEEVAKVEEMCRRIGLDYGEIDTLRDRESGLLYVVDFARTPAGPPNHLSAADARVATERMAAAFHQRFIAN